jgi:hypothetical protein
LGSEGTSLVNPGFNRFITDEILDFLSTLSQPHDRCVAVAVVAKNVSVVMIDESFSDYLDGSGSIGSEYDVKAICIRVEVFENSFPGCIDTN